NLTLPVDKALADLIAATPGNYYVNVHTSNNKGGEIRGQLTPLADAAQFAGGVRARSARL
ncbi:MAG: CHRD domain-containing protein, partial [Burkholderiales bacterium]